MAFVPNVHKPMRFLIVFLSLCSFFAQAQPKTCDQSIDGQIFDLNTGEPLPFATVTIVGTDKGNVSDDIGHFSISDICKDEVHLEVRFIGYKTVVHHHDFHHASPKIYLAPDATELKSVIVENSNIGEIESISIQKKEINKLSLVITSMSQLTGQMSGVSLLNTGVNISKPMIHGLHSNRVLVINDGVRHAYQVWGQEHAPEIDPSHVDQIEIVKGAGTVKYGPEALGGVILYNSKRPEFDQELNGSVGSSYQTNGGSVTSQFNIGHGAHRIAWNASAFGTYQGDLEAPDYTLTNTGKREYGASFNALLHRPKLDLKISGSYFNQELGILRGSLVGNLEDLQNAIEKGVPSPSNPASYDIQNPRQVTEHGLIKIAFSYFLGEHVFNVQYAFQNNVREEYDVRRGELNDRPVIDLDLNSHTIDTEWLQAKQGNWSGSSGIQFFTQRSRNEPGSNPVNFVPDYDIPNIGVYTIQSLNFNNTTLELGARFDFQSPSVADDIREVNSYSNELSYKNATFTLGFKKELNEGLTLFSNIGTAWRPPNVAELYSFGYHNSRIQFGLWRYSLEPQITTPIDRVFDESDREVPSERGIKWVSGVELKHKRLSAEFIFFANQINNYIFLRPYGITTNVAGTFPYFIFDQTNALLIGSDWDVRYQHSDELSSEIKISYVFARDMKNDQPFTEIPPLNANYSIDYRRGSWGFGLNVDYTATQWDAPTVIEPIDFQNGTVEIVPDEIFDFMIPPDDYFLLGGQVTFQKSSWSLAFNIGNLLNTNYRVYTDQLRYFSNMPGRNFSIAAEFKF
jgi:iron complex outermembrane receptor protein